MQKLKILGVITIVIGLVLSAVIIMYRSHWREYAAKHHVELRTEEDMEHVMESYPDMNDKNEYITLKEARMWLLIGGGILVITGYFLSPPRKS